MKKVVSQSIHVEADPFEKQNENKKIQNINVGDWERFTSSSFMNENWVMSLGKIFIGFAVVASSRTSYVV